MSREALPGKFEARAVGTGRAVTLTTLLLGLFLSGWAPAYAQASTGAKEPAGESRGQGNGHQTIWLKIMAFAEAPVVGADVRVSVQRSQGKLLVDEEAATNDQGVFPAALGSHHSSSLRVSISGGTVNGIPFPWHLSADVEVDDAANSIVVVNPATTLVSLLRDYRPNLKLGDAEALVRRFFGLPENFSLGLALRESAGYGSPLFSPGALALQADSVGGLDALEMDLVDELLGSSSATHPFRGSGRLRGVGTFIAQNLAAGALKWAGGQGAGWVMQSTGLPTSGATPGDISNLQRALADLQSSVDALSRQVSQLTTLVQSTATQTQYNTIVVPALALAAQVNGVGSDLSYFALACPPLPDGSTQKAPDAFCVNQKISVNAELTSTTIQQAYVQEVAYVQDNPTVNFKGILHLYSLWLGQSKPFFRPADSTKMQNLYDYWDAVLTQAANLKVELLHENGAQDNAGGQTQLIDFLGNPNLSPATTGTFQANQAADMKLMFPAVPNGTVISTQDHSMWSINPWAPSGQSYSPAASCYAVAWPFLTSIDVAWKNSPPYAGFNDWEPSPTYEQWQKATAQAPAGQEWRDWLTAQTQTGPDETPASPGFFNWTRVCAGGYGAWTTTKPAGLEHATPPWFWYMIPYKVKDQFEQRAINNTFGFDFPARSLAAGEQYYWYN